MAELSSGAMTAATSGARLRSSSPSVPRVAYTGFVTRSAYTMTPTSTTIAPRARSRYERVEVLRFAPRRSAPELPSRRSPVFRRSPAFPSPSTSTLSEEAEIAEEPPQDDEDEDGAE